MKLAELPRNAKHALKEGRNAFPDKSDHEIALIALRESFTDDDAVRDERLDDEEQAAAARKQGEISIF